MKSWFLAVSIPPSTLLAAVLLLVVGTGILLLFRRLRARRLRDQSTQNLFAQGLRILPESDAERQGQLQSLAMSAEQQSTWQKRRLFVDFREVAGDDNAVTAASVVKILPEELSVGDDEYVFGPVTAAIAQLLPETAARQQHQRTLLAAAGFHSPAAWLNLTAIRFLGAFLSMVIVGFWLVIAPPELEIWLLALVVMAPLVMWALPPLFVAMRARERRTDIERGLPDVLDMLNMCVSQGLTVPNSLKRIGVELTTAHPALAEELSIVSRQSQVSSLSQALRSFGTRVNSPDVSSFTSLLIQSEVTGTSISRALQEYSDSIRSSLRERADSRANAASFKLLFPVSLCLMPSVFLFLLGPAIIEMSDFFGNRASALNTNRQNALETMQQQPRIDAASFDQSRI